MNLWDNKLGSQSLSPRIMLIFKPKICKSHNCFNRQEKLAMPPYVCVIAVVLIFYCAVAYSAVLPLEKPGLGVRVEAGKYLVRGRIVEVRHTVELPIEPPDKVKVVNEEHVLSDQSPVAWHSGTALRKTLGPVDTSTRLPYAIVPESVRVHSLPNGGTIYKEGKDYFLDHVWGGISRLGGGEILRTSQFT